MPVRPGFPLLIGAMVLFGVHGDALYAQDTRASTAPDAQEPVAPRFDHSAFDALLHAHVQDGRVDYAAFRGNGKFAAYLSSLRAANLTGMEEAERIAFWLNTYNAYTIQLVASRGETASIRNINKTWGVLRLKGPWTEAIVQAAGQTLTLDDVEHRILRHEFAEPRVHFAMSLAALGGPKLRSEAYTGPKLEEQLEAQGWEFMHDSLKNRVDTSYRAVYVSPVIARYRSDFGESPVALARFIADYYPDGPERRFLMPPRRAGTGDGQPARADVRGNGAPAAPGAPNASAPNPVAPNAGAQGVQSNQRPEFRFLRVIETPFDWSLNIQKHQ